MQGLFSFMNGRKIWNGWIIYYCEIQDERSSSMEENAVNPLIHEEKVETKTEEKKPQRKQRPPRTMSFYIKKYLVICLGAMIAAIGLEVFLII